MDIQPTEKPQRFLGPKGQEIVLEVENSLRGLYMRMTIDGEKSPVLSSYQSILTFKGFGLCTGYYEGTLPHERPFQIIECKEDR